MCPVNRHTFWLGPCGCGMAPPASSYRLCRILSGGGVARADGGWLWMGSLLLLRVVEVVERGTYFGESVRNCWRSCCGLGLVCLRWRLRVRGKSRLRSHV